MVSEEPGSTPKPREDLDLGGRERTPGQAVVRWFRTEVAARYQVDVEFEGSAPLLSGGKKGQPATPLPHRVERDDRVESAILAEREMARVVMTGGPGGSRLLRLVVRRWGSMEGADSIPEAGRWQRIEVGKDSRPGQRRLPGDTLRLPLTLPANATRLSLAAVGDRNPELLTSAAAELAVSWKAVDGQRLTLGDWSLPDSTAR